MPSKKEILGRLNLRDLANAFPGIRFSLMDKNKPVLTVSGTPEQIDASVAQALATKNNEEFDPTGRDPATLGVKLDGGKIRAALVLHDFARALKLVCKVGSKAVEVPPGQKPRYLPHSWLHVPNAIERYKDAGERHMLDGAIEPNDSTWNLPHLAHEIWCKLAVLELQLREEEQNDEVKIPGATAMVAVLSPGSIPARVGDAVRTVAPAPGDNLHRQHPQRLDVQRMGPRAHRGHAKNRTRGRKAKAKR